MDKTAYADAWTEGEEDAPAQNAVAAAAKKAAATDKDAYITAYADLEDGKAAKGEDVKDKDVKDKAKAKSKDEEKSA
jgi:hypothetical protein